jgi:hypothetical protein
VVATINRLPNCSTKVAPFEAVFLEKPQLCEYDLVTQTEDLSLDEYTKRRLEAKRKLHERITACQKQADENLRKQCQPKIVAPEILDGDSVLIHRPNSAIAKRTKVPWVGPYTVQATNGSVVLIEDTEGAQDWVHRTQVQKIENRKPALGPLPPFPDFRIPLRATQYHHEPYRAQLNAPEMREMRDVSLEDTPDSRIPEIESNTPAADNHNDTVDEFHTPPDSPVKDRVTSEKTVPTSPASVAGRTRSRTPGPMRKTRSMTRTQRGDDHQTQELLKSLAPFQLRRSSRNRKSPE